MEAESPVPDLSINVSPVLDIANSAVNQTLRYGFSISSLNFIYDSKIACELVKGTAIYSVPNTPLWMLGLINLRGGLVPVFNLEKYFEFKEEETDNHKLLLVLGKGEKAVAFQLKKYPELLDNLMQLDSLPKLVPKIDGYILAAYNSAEKTWLELDKDKFFSTLGEKVCI